MATFSETSALTFRKNVAEPCMYHAKYTRIPKFFCSNSPIFTLELWPQKCQIFRAFLPRKEPLFATFNETRALTSRKSATFFTFFYSYQVIYIQP